MPESLHREPSVKSETGSYPATVPSQDPTIVQTQVPPNYDMYPMYMVTSIRILIIILTYLN